MWGIRIALKLQICSVKFRYYQLYRTNNSVQTRFLLLHYLSQRIHFLSKYIEWLNEPKRIFDSVIIIKAAAVSRQWPGCVTSGLSTISCCSYRASLDQYVPRTLIIFEESLKRLWWKIAANLHWLIRVKIVNSLIITYSNQKAIRHDYYWHCSLDSVLFDNREVSSTKEVSLWQRT